MFLDCPAYLDDEGAVRCGLPAEVLSRFAMRSTGGPLESAMIRCASGHWFNAPIEFLTLPTAQKHDPGSAAMAPGRGGGTSLSSPHHVTADVGYPAPWQTLPSSRLPPAGEAPRPRRPHQESL
jgi:hypothetical protein